MSITDELRGLAIDPLLGYASQKVHAEAIIAIADRIDAVHEKAMSRAGQLLDDAEKERDYNYANWQDCKQKVLQHNITIDELDAKIESLEDELSRCIKMPKDAYDEPIHIGDVLQWPEDGDTFEVIGIGKDGVLFYFDHDTEGETVDWTASQNKRHYHAPTVEDVLREFTHAILNQKEEYREQNIAKYAAKLQLADDGKEQ